MASAAQWVVPDADALGTWRAIVHHLPTELLVDIFFLFLASRPKFPDYYKSLETLMKVFKAWYAAIVETPTFWTVINSADRGYGRCLARSNDALLAVTYDDQVECGHPEVAQKLIHQAHLWVSVDFLLDSNW